MLDPKTGKYIPSEFEAELIKALRSGKYRQLKGVLRGFNVNKEIGFCCLGVACDISGLSVWNYSGYLGDHTSLPRAVKEKLNWSSENGYIRDYEDDIYVTDLAVLNDMGFTFDQIADIIEAGLIVHQDEI